MQRRHFHLGPGNGAYGFPERMSNQGTENLSLNLVGGKRLRLPANLGRPLGEEDGSR